MEWTEELLAEKNAMKLRKSICCNCGYSNPIMDLINTVNCINCGFSSVSLIENGYYIIDKETYSVLDASNIDNEYLLFDGEIKSSFVKELYGSRLKSESEHIIISSDGLYLFLDILKEN